MRTVALRRLKLKWFSHFAALFLFVATCPTNSAFAQTLTNQFVVINPATGVFTPLNTNVGDASVDWLQGVSTVNPNAHQFYVLRLKGEASHILSINTQTGSFVESPALSNSLISLEFDSGTNTLLGITGLTLLSFPVPTMNEWGIIILMILTGLGSFYYLRKQRSQ